jgi:hypothetical protein
MNKAKEAAAFLPKGLTTEQKVVTMYKEKVPLRQIADYNTVSMGKVYEYLRKHGVGLRKGKKVKTKVEQRIEAMTPEQIHDLIQDYRGGMVLDTIYAKYGVNKNLCYQLLAIHNVPLRTAETLHTRKAHSHNNQNRKKKEEHIQHPDAKLENLHQELIKPTRVELKRVGDELHVIIDKQPGDPIRKVVVEFSEVVR